MDLKKLFPFSYKADGLKNFLVTLVIYIILDLACGIVIGVAGGLPLVGWAFRLIGWVAGIYISVGIIFAILRFLGFLK